MSPIVWEHSQINSVVLDLFVSCLWINVWQLSELLIFMDAVDGHCCISCLFCDVQVQLVGLEEESSEFVCRNTFDHPYPTTKIMWIPDTKGVYPDLLATSGDYLRIWRVCTLSATHSCLTALRKPTWDENVTYLIINACSWSCCEHALVHSKKSKCITFVQM